MHIDPQWYLKKPTKFETSIINDRIIEEITEVTPAELADLVGNKGHTMLLTLMNGKRQTDNMIQQQVLALDFDNTVKRTKEKSKEPHYQSMANVLANEFVQKYASFVYKTFNYSEDWERFRVVFILNTPLMTNEQVTKAYTYLLQKFPDVDSVASASARLFYGGNAAQEINYANELPVELLQNDEIVETKGSSHLSTSETKVSTPSQSFPRGRIPTYKLIKEGRFEDVSDRWKKYGHKNFPDKKAAITYLNTLPMAELLETPRNPFRNIFKKDVNPSCTIWKSDKGNNWLYTQLNETGKNGHNLTYDIIQVMQKLLRKPYHRYEQNDLPPEMAIHFLIEHLGITIDVSAEIELLRNQADHFKEILLSGDLQDKYPEMYQILGRYGYTSYVTDIIDIIKMELPYEPGATRCLTHTSVEIFAIRLNCSKQKVSKLLNLMTFTNILKKLDDDQIPEELLTTIRKTQTHSYKNGIYEQRKTARQYRSNVYELTNVKENLLTIQKKCAELVDNGFTQKAFSKEWVDRTFGKSEADRVFPQDKKRTISPTSIAITEDIHKVALAHIQTDGYVIVNELKAEIQELWGSKGFVEYKYQQAIAELLVMYNLKKIRLTTELKNQFDRTDLAPKASPTILMKVN